MLYRVRQILLFVTAMTFALPSRAVLPEDNIDRTLVMLSEDMRVLAQNIDTDLSRFDERLIEFRDNVEHLDAQCDEIGLVLYTQDERYMYGALQATQSMRNVITQIQSEEKTLTQLEEDITTISSRYAQLTQYLEKLSSRQLTDEGREALSTSHILADSLNRSLQRGIISINAEKAKYGALLSKTKDLENYNEKVLAQLHKRIFTTGNEPFPSLLSHFSSRWKEFVFELRWRFLTGQTDTEVWNSAEDRMNEILSIFSYVAIAVALIFFICTKFKKLCPRRIKSKRLYFALLLGLTVKVIGYFFTPIILGASHQFNIKLTLESELYILALLITASLIIRLEEPRIGRALASYLPMLLTAYMLIEYRVDLVPISTITFTAPFLFLAMIIFQWVVMIVNRCRIDITDKRILQANLIVTTACFIFTYFGYSVLSIMFYLFWIGIVNGIMLVAFGRAYLKKRGLARNGYLRLTINKFIFPLFFPALVLASLTWVAHIFNLTLWFKDLLDTPFINMPEKVGVISASKIIFIYGLGICVNFGVNLIKMILKRKPENRQGQVAVLISVCNIIVWLLYIVAVLIILDINRGGILAAIGGASVGIGFALKDTFENFFYGMSLMGGRARPGDIIEYEGVRGKVLDVGVISTSMVTEDGPIMAMPNRQLFENDFRNMTRNHRVEYRHITFDISADNDVDKVRSIILDSFHGIDGVDNERKHVVIMRNFGCGILRVELKVWIDTEKYLAAEPAVREAVFKAFRDNGIEAATFLQKIDADASSSIMKNSLAFK